MRLPPRGVCCVAVAKCLCCPPRSTAPHRVCVRRAAGFATPTIEGGAPTGCSSSGACGPCPQLDGTTPCVWVCSMCPPARPTTWACVRVRAVRGGGTCACAGWREAASFESPPSQVAAGCLGPRATASCPPWPLLVRRWCSPVCRRPHSGVRAHTHTHTHGGAPPRSQQHRWCAHHPSHTDTCCVPIAALVAHTPKSTQPLPTHTTWHFFKHNHMHTVALRGSATLQCTPT